MLQIATMLALSLFLTLSYAADTGSQFITVRLAHGASVEIPRNWQVIRGAEKFELETTVGTLIDLSGYTEVFKGYDTLLVAVFPNPELYSGVSITSFPVASVTPSFALSVTESDLKSSEISGRQSIETTLSRLGSKVFAWTPIRKMKIKPNVITYTSYVRTSDGGDTRVHMYKFFGMGRIFDVALSTRVTQEHLSQPILERIIQSFIVG